MNRKSFSALIILLLSFSFFCTNSKPTVVIRYPGLIGNCLFVFAFGKIVSEELGFNLQCQPIYGFPNTYQFSGNQPSHAYSSQYYTEPASDLNMMHVILSSTHQRNIILQGYFQRYLYLEPYALKIRHDWLKIDPVLKAKYQQNPNDIVLHIRFNNNPVFLPFSYYEQALAIASYNRLFICTDEPYHPDLQQFQRYNPIIKSTLPLSDVLDRIHYNEICQLHFDDFLFIASFNKIIASNSTYCWWAAFLSEATEIYAADRTMHYGRVNESRYHYIHFE